MANIDLIDFQLQKIFNEYMRLDPKNHPIFIVEPPVHNREHRLKLVDLLFDKYKVQGVFFHKAPILSS